MGRVTFAKTSGTVTRYKGKNWPIAARDRCVPSYNPRNHCGTHLGSMQFPYCFYCILRIETIEMEKLLCLLNAIFLKSSPDFLIGLLIYNAFIVKHKSQRIFYCLHGPTLSQTFSSPEPPGGLGTRTWCLGLQEILGTRMCHGLNEFKICAQQVFVLFMPQFFTMENSKT